MFRGKLENLKQMRAADDWLTRIFRIYLFDYSVQAVKQKTYQTTDHACFG